MEYAITLAISALASLIAYGVGRAAGRAKEAARRPPANALDVIDRLRGALEPFATSFTDGCWSNGEPYSDSDTQSINHRLGVYRRARKVYEETTPGQ